MNKFLATILFLFSATSGFWLPGALGLHGVQGGLFAAFVGGVGGYAAAMIWLD